MKTKIPLDFMVQATKKAQREVELMYQNTNCVHATKQITCFYHQDNVVCMIGNLHDQVDAPFCVEFDITYVSGNGVIRDQRIFN